MADLLPCPFCGGRAETMGGDSLLFGVSCRNCGAHISKVLQIDESGSSIVAAWNRRAHPAVTPAPTLADAAKVPEIAALLGAVRGAVTDMQRAGLLWSAERLNAALRRIAEGQP